MNFCRNFWSHQKTFSGVPFSVLEIFWFRKNLWIRGVGGISRFSVRNVLSHSAEKIVQESFSGSLIRVLKHFLHKSGMS